MSSSVQTIPVINLTLMALPVALVIGVMFNWSLSGWKAIYAVGRMLLQLFFIGYLLVYIFSAKQPYIIIVVICTMLLISGAIALHPVKKRRYHIYLHTTLSIAIGGMVTLVLVTQLVLQLNPWFLPQYMIPIAGMIFANAMNAVSLAAERFTSELDSGTGYLQARKLALNVSLIPLINGMFAVGLVSLPGMMTGQILSGVSPLIAARYQIVVMCMVFSSAGISVICYLLLADTRYFSEKTPG